MTYSVYERRHCIEIVDGDDRNDIEYYMNDRQGIQQSIPIYIVICPVNGCVPKQEQQ